MAEYLLNRRYCRFNNRNTNRKSSMIMDEEANFKVKRFIEDINKYREKSEKRKARKEAKVKDNVVTWNSNRGIFKNAIISKPGIRDLMNDSTKARLDGDLFALCQNYNKQKNNAANHVANQRKECFEQENNDDPPQQEISRNKSSESLILRKSVNNDIADMATVPQESFQLNKIIQIKTNKRQEFINERHQEVVQQNKENDLILSEEEKEEENCFRDEMLGNPGNSKQLPYFQIEAPSSIAVGFFDTTNKTPEKKKSSFEFQPQIESPKLFNFNTKDFFREHKTSTPLKKGRAPTRRALFPDSSNNESPNEFLSEKNDFLTNLGLHDRNNKMKNYHFTAPLQYMQKCPIEIHQNDNSQDRYQDYNRPCSPVKHSIKRKSKLETDYMDQYFDWNTLKKKYNNNYLEPFLPSTHEEPEIPIFSAINEMKKTNHFGHKHKNINLNRNKYFCKYKNKESLFDRQRIKLRLNAGQKNAFWAINNPFKRSFKFSPHKYC